MLPAKTARTRSVGTKLTEEEYARLEALAAERNLTLGEWVREVLLEAAGQPAPEATATEQTLLAEVLALHTILLNLFYDLAAGQPPSRERMQALIEKADGDKREKALLRLKYRRGRRAGRGMGSRSAPERSSWESRRRPSSKP